MLLIIPYMTLSAQWKAPSFLNLDYIMHLPVTLPSALVAYHTSFTFLFEDFLSLSVFVYPIYHYHLLPFSFLPSPYGWLVSRLKKIVCTLPIWSCGRICMWCWQWLTDKDGWTSKTWEARSALWKRQKAYWQHWCCRSLSIFYLSKYKNIFRKNSHHILYFFSFKAFHRLVAAIKFCIYTNSPTGQF